MENANIKVSKPISNGDRLSQLPDFILLQILSFLSLNESVATTLLSHRWHGLWRSVYILNLWFPNSVDMLSLKYLKKQDVQNERSSFTIWVNRILDLYLGEKIDTFKIAFDLNDTSRSDIDQWVHFLSSKSVKRLELDFSPPVQVVYLDPLTNSYVLPIKYTYPVDFERTLTSLTLCHVNVTTERVECLLNSCILLEYLCIKTSDLLTSIRASFALRLKHLVVLRCPNLNFIDFSSPNLLSLTYDGHPIDINIRDASLLSDLSLAGGEGDEVVVCAFRRLSAYFSQFQRLYMDILLPKPCDLNISQVPALTNLKHLEICVLASYEKSLLGWRRLLVACPVLQKVTLKFRGYVVFHSPELPRPKLIRGQPLSNCLKTLEIFGYNGYYLDKGFAMFVLHNAARLEKVILSWNDKPTDGPWLRARTLHVPDGVELVDIS